MSSFKQRQRYRDPSVSRCILHRDSVGSNGSDERTQSYIKTEIYIIKLAFVSDELLRKKLTSLGNPPLPLVLFGKKVFKFLTKIC